MLLGGLVGKLTLTVGEVRVLELVIMVALPLFCEFVMTDGGRLIVFKFIRKTIHETIPNLGFDGGL